MDERYFVSNELDSIILNNQVTATLVMNEVLQVKYANPSAEQLFSQSAKRIVDQPLSKLIQHLKFSPFGN